MNSDPVEETPWFHRAYNAEIKINLEDGGNIQ
jgi:hypothetical protein